MLRVVSWNVLAQSFVSTHADEAKSPFMRQEQRIARIREVIRYADVAMLQEVDFYEELQAALRDDFRYSAWAHRTHGHGMCIFSKVPILSSVSYERYVVATLANSVKVASVHLKSKEHNEYIRVNQVSGLLECRTLASGKVIVGGDWNTLPENDSHKLMVQEGYTETTTGVTTCKLVCGTEVARVSDYVWTRGLKIMRPGRESVRELLPTEKYPSDHFPVFRTIKMPE